MAKSLVLYSSCSLHRRKDYLQKYEGDDFAVISTAQIHPFTYLIIVADAADAVSVNFSGRCKFLQI